MERLTKEELITEQDKFKKDSSGKCSECEDIICYNLPFVRRIRIVSFPAFNIKTFSLDAIEECLIKEKRENGKTE